MHLLVLSHMQGDLPTAVQHYRAAVAVNPFHADAWTNRESFAGPLPQRVHGPVANPNSGSSPHMR
jgi:hypothetical protein